MWELTAACVHLSQIQYLPSFCILAYLSTACCSQIGCKSSDSMFPSYSTFIPFFFSSLHNIRENCLSHTNIWASQEVWDIQSLRWMDARGRWLPSHLSLCLLVLWRLMQTGEKCTHPHLSHPWQTAVCQVVVCSSIVVWHPDFSPFHNTPLLPFPLSHLPFFTHDIWDWSEHYSMCAC